MSNLSIFARTFLQTSMAAIAWTPLHAANLYWDTNGTTAGAGATPDGTWGVDSFWNTSSAGTAGTFSTGMTQADVGFFSAGTDAINAYTVTVNGTQNSGSLTFEDGTPTLTSGTIALGAAKILTAAATLNSTATIASALTVNTTAATTLTLTANDGAAETDLLISGPISATSANIYQLRFSGAGNTRIEGAISGHGGKLGPSAWTGTVTIAGNQTLGSSGISLTGANNKLVMGDSTADAQSWSGGTTISQPSALMTIRSTATAGVITMRGGGGTLEVEGILNATAFVFGLSGTSDSTQFGTLKLSGGNASFTGSSFTIHGTGSKIIGGAASYGTLTMNNTSAFTIGSNLTLGGNGTNENNFHLVKSGTQTLTLSGANTFNGTTTINGGTLTLANQNAIQNSTLVMTGGGNITFSNAEAANAFTVGGLSAASSGTGYNIALSNNAGSAIALTVGNNNAATTYAGVLTGSGSLVKTGSGTLTLSGSNSYSGGTTLDTGTLVIGNTAAAGTGTLTQTDGTSLLKLDTTGTIANAMSIYNVASNKTVTISGNITAQNTTYDVADGTTLSLNGTISGTGGITKNGTGTLEVNGASNTYTGATVINAGTLEANASGALGASGNITVHNGGSLLVKASNAINDSSAMELAGGTLKFSGAVTDTIGALPLSANSVIDLGTGSVSAQFADLAMGIYNLSIYNWTGTKFFDGGDGNNTDKVYFTRQLTSSELQRISFYSDFGSSFLGTGFQFMAGTYQYEVIPVPEAETWVAAVVLLSGMGVAYLRKKRRLA